MSMGEVEHIGMKTTWKRDSKCDEGNMMKAIIDEVRNVMNFDWTGDCEEYSNNARWIKRDFQEVFNMSGDGINTINRHNNRIKSSINKTDFDKRGFAGNSGHCRFIKPYADAHDQAIIETGSYFWAEIEGMKAMSIHYGFDIPAWMP